MFGEILCMSGNTKCILLYYPATYIYITAISSLHTCISHDCIHNIIRVVVLSRNDFFNFLIQICMVGTA